MGLCGPQALRGSGLSLHSAPFHQEHLLRRRIRVSDLPLWVRSAVQEGLLWEGWDLNLLQAPRGGWAPILCQARGPDP